MYILKDFEISKGNVGISKEDVEGWLEAGEVQISVGDVTPVIWTNRLSDDKFSEMTVPGAIPMFRERWFWKCKLVGESVVVSLGEVLWGTLLSHTSVKPTTILKSFKVVDSIKYFKEKNPVSKTNQLEK